MQSEEARRQAVDEQALTREPQTWLRVEVAGLNLRIGADPVWRAGLEPLLANYFADFLVSEPRVKADLELLLSPAREGFRSADSDFWNARDPFRVESATGDGVWIHAREFSCLRRGPRVHAWMPTPRLDFMDSIDNCVALAVQEQAAERGVFLFHCAIVEHEGSAVVFFGPSGIGKSTLAKLSRDLGYRVMGSDQAYLQIRQGEIWASASPTTNPDIPRTPDLWVTRPLRVKALVPLIRRGSFEVSAVDLPELSRRLLGEVFTDLSKESSRASFDFAVDLAKTPGVAHFGLSYPKGFDFWPELKKTGYI